MNWLRPQTLGQDVDVEALCDALASLKPAQLPEFRRA